MSFINVCRNAKRVRQYSVYWASCILYLHNANTPCLLYNLVLYDLKVSNWTTAFASTLTLIFICSYLRLEYWKSCRAAIANSLLTSVHGYILCNWSVLLSTVLHCYCVTLGILHCIFSRLSWFSSLAGHSWQKLTCLVLTTWRFVKHQSIYQSINLSVM